MAIKLYRSVRILTSKNGIKIKLNCSTKYEHFKHEKRVKSVSQGKLLKTHFFMIVAVSYELITLQLVE